MFDIKILIRKCTAVNRDGACSIAVEEIAALDHEGMDTAVEDRVFVAHGFAGGGFMFSSAELAEVFDGLGGAVGVEFEFHAALGDAADGDVEEDDGVGVG